MVEKKLLINTEGSEDPAQVLIFRWTSESRPNSIEGKNVRPSVRPYVRTSVRPQKVSSI